MLTFYENDVKIAGEHPLLKSETKGETEFLEKTLVHEKSNGNLEKARQLGAILASEVWGNYGFTYLDEISEESNAAAIQARILFCFTVNVYLNKHSKNELIAKKTLSSFNDSLKAEAPHFFSELEQSSSFSFYYLEYRSGGNIEKGIGKAFAMLCSMEGNASIADLGEKLFLRFSDIVKDYIEKIKFID